MRLDQSLSTAANWVAGLPLKSRMTGGRMSATGKAFSAFSALFTAAGTMLVIRWIPPTARLISVGRSRAIRPRWSTRIEASVPPSARKSSSVTAFCSMREDDSRFAAISRSRSGKPTSISGVLPNDAAK